MSKTDIPGFKHSMSTSFLKIAHLIPTLLSLILCQIILDFVICRIPTCEIIIYIRHM